MSTFCNIPNLATKLCRTKRREANWIRRILHSICFLRHVVEGKVEGGKEVIGRRRDRRKQLPYGLEEKRGYCKLKKKHWITLSGEAVDIP